jgi:uncharacterized membrane protein YhhN
MGFWRVPMLRQCDNKMNNTNTAAVLVIVCLGGAIISVVGEWRQWPFVRATAKLAASTAFIALAAVNGAGNSGYGQLILLALCLSWVGDALLLSGQSSYLLAGVAAFFLAHVVFATAFVTLRLDTVFVMIGFTIMCIVAAVTLRWLWPHLESFYKIAVPFYFVAITIMASLAVGASSPPMSPLLGIAAIAFAASDVSVARDRFVVNSIVNKAWGLPLYFAAQILFALSVVSYK